MTMTIAKIESERKKLESKQFTNKTYTDVQNRLKNLVDKHGIEFVAAATGLTMGTIRQYTRVSVAPAISLTTVERAELILKGL